MFSFYRWKSIRTFHIERIVFWNVVAFWKQFRKNKQLPLHLKKTIHVPVFCIEMWLAKEVLSLQQEKDEKKEKELHIMHNESDEW